MGDPMNETSSPILSEDDKSLDDVHKNKMVKEDLKTSLERAHQALVDVLNLTLNVSKHDAPNDEVVSSKEPARQQQIRQQNGQDPNQQQNRQQQFAPGQQQQQQHVQQQGQSQNKVDDQQKRLIDTFLIECKNLETQFAYLCTTEGKSDIQLEIANLEKEIELKDKLIEKVTNDLKKWTE